MSCRCRRPNLVLSVLPDEYWMVIPKFRREDSDYITSSRTRPTTALYGIATQLQQLAQHTYV